VRIYAGDESIYRLEMDLYGLAASRTRRALWALEETGLPFEFHPVDFRGGEQRSAAYLAMNPNGKVPVLKDGDFCLFESAAICNYVGEKVPERELVPVSGTQERALYDQWMFFVVGELEQPLWSIGKHKFALPKEWRRTEMFEVAAYEWTVAAGVLASQLGSRETIIPGRFTMADVMIGHTLTWAQRFKVPFGHDNLERYLNVLLARPAYQRTEKYTDVK
jgi:glutathione S-transferase